jgi:hypothetical protein
MGSTAGSYINVWNNCEGKKPLNIINIIPTTGRQESIFFGGDCMLCYCNDNMDCNNDSNCQNNGSLCGSSDTYAYVILITNNTNATQTQLASNSSNITAKITASSYQNGINKTTINVVFINNSPNNYYRSGDSYTITISCCQKLRESTMEAEYAEGVPTANSLTVRSLQERSDRHYDKYKVSKYY